MTKGDAAYISEFEELLKIKDFSQNREMKMPFYCTYELIAKALKEEYVETIDEKIKRWVDATHVLYFENVKPVTYYLQAKMLYRDGFYEASIVLSRSVCEMICFELLSKIPHPFGDIDAIEVPMYRAFVNFLAIPKAIERNIFENHIIGRINNLDDANFIKSSYELDKPSNIFNFKIKNGQKKNNLERLLRIFGAVDFNRIDNFRNDSYQYLHRVYDIGNMYVHTKKISRPAKEDAIECLNMLAHILSDLFGVPSLQINRTIKSGYSDFPDICKGMNFAFSIALTPQDAQRVYFNLPSQEQVNLLMQTVGTWNGEWKNKDGESQTGTLTVSAINEENLNSHLRYSDTGKRYKIEPLEIRLFGNYFHLIGFDKKDMKHKKNKHVYFELEFFNNVLLLGQNIEYPGKVIFQRVG